LSLSTPPSRGFSWMDHRITLWKSQETKAKAGMNTFDSTLLVLRAPWFFLLCGQIYQPEMPKALQLLVSLEPVLRLELLQSSMSSRCIVSFMGFSIEALQSVANTSNNGNSLSKNGTKVTANFLNFRHLVERFPRPPLSAIAYVTKIARNTGERKGRSGIVVPASKWKTTPAEEPWSKLLHQGTC